MTDIPTQLFFYKRSKEKTFSRNFYNRTSHTIYIEYQQTKILTQYLYNIDKQNFSHNLYRVSTNRNSHTISIEDRQTELLTQFLEDRQRDILT